MKTANTRLRFKDIKVGVILYVSHPVYGIEKYRITRKPYFHKVVGCWFAEYQFPSIIDGRLITSTFSLRDAGIMPGNAYNGRRAFRKLKQAQAWQEKWGKSKWFIAQHARHVAFNAACDSYGYDEY